MAHHKPSLRFHAGATAALCAVTGIASSTTLQAAPAWYTAGTGGFIANTNDPTKAAAAPTVPDFYQHQNWAPQPVKNANGQITYNTNSANGWESAARVANTPFSGWCGFTSYADTFYDLQSQGYVIKTMADPTTAANWFTATYGPAGKPLQSNIVVIANAFGGTFKNTSLQTFLNNNVNAQKQTDANGNPLANITSQIFNVDPSSGMVTYFSYSTNARVTIRTRGSDNTFAFTNDMLRRGEDVRYVLGPGTNKIVNDPSTQNLWWIDHALAVSGISVANSTVYVADPDSNGGPGTANQGWIRNNPNFPGVLATAANAPLPVPALNSFNANDPTTFNSNYDRFQVNNVMTTLNGKNIIAPTVTSPDAPQFNNTFLTGITTIGPTLVNNIKVSPRLANSAILAGIKPADTSAAGDQTDITLQIPADATAIDKLLIEPAAQVIDPSANATGDGLLDDTSPASQWSVTDDPTDPYGNLMTDGSIEYDLTSGNPLEPGDLADLNIATTADFSTLGYDVLIHYQGDPSDEWTPEMIGGSEYDPSDYPTDDAVDVPEPSKFTMLSILGMTLLARTARPGHINS
jgi:hypothetical protein